MAPKKATEISKTEWDPGAHHPNIHVADHASQWPSVARAEPPGKFRTHATEKRDVVLLNGAQSRQAPPPVPSQGVGIKRPRSLIGDEL